MTAHDDARPDTTVLGNDAGLPAGLIAWYTFDAGGSIIDDRIANHFATCTTTTCPSPGPGHLAGGLVFDGVDDCLDVTDDGQLQLPQITLAIWANQVGGGTLSHVSKRVVGGSVNSWQLETEALGMPTLSLSFTTYDGSGLNQYARTQMNTITPGQWQFLVGTFDGVTKHVYIDGIEATSMAQTSPLPYDSNPMKIGCDDNAPLGEFYSGTLDDLQIYNRALTPFEIANLAVR